MAWQIDAHLVVGDGPGIELEIAVRQAEAPDPDAGVARCKPVRHALRRGMWMRARCSGLPSMSGASSTRSPGTSAEQFAGHARAPCPGGMDRVAVLLLPGVERRDHARDAFLADLHRAPDAVILQQAGVDRDRARARRRCRRSVRRNSCARWRSRCRRRPAADRQGRAHRRHRRSPARRRHGRSRRNRASPIMPLCAVWCDTTKTAAAVSGPSARCNSSGSQRSAVPTMSSRCAGQADHLADQRAEVGVVAALHDHAAFHARRVGQLCDPVAVRAGHGGCDRDGDARRRTRGDAAGFAAERRRDLFARQRLQMRDLDRFGQDRQRRRGRGRVRRAAAEHADRPGRIYDLARRRIHLSCRSRQTDRNERTWRASRGSKTIPKSGRIGPRRCSKAARVARSPSRAATR